MHLRLFTCYNFVQNLHEEEFLLPLVNMVTFYLIQKQEAS